MSIYPKQLIPPDQLSVAHIETGRHLYGGAQQVVYLLQGLANRGVRNLLIAPQNSEISAAVQSNGSAKVITTRHSGDLSLGFYRETRRILNAEQPKLVHMQLLVLWPLPSMPAHTGGLLES